jgi:ABC-type proline/glycine betaine transport system substrate-binding protein
VPSQVFANYFDLKKISYSWNNGNKESHCTIKTYLAQRNDSVVKIVRKFKISIDDFNEMNPTVKYIRPGMRLIICK